MSHRMEMVRINGDEFALVTMPLGADAHICIAVLVEGGVPDAERVVCYFVDASEGGAISLVREKLKERPRWKWRDELLLELEGDVEHLEGKMREYEEKYGMSSDEFEERFMSGELGDDLQWFEWHGLWMARETCVEVAEVLRALDRSVVDASVARSETL